MTPDEMAKYAEPCLRLLSAMAAVAGTDGGLEVFVEEYEREKVRLLNADQPAHASYVDALQGLARRVLGDVEAEAAR